MSTYSKEYYLKNKAKYAEYGRKYRAKSGTKERIKKYHLNYYFGVTPELFAEMYEQQNGLCAVCGKAQKNKKLAVDHNHKTGQVRGLLCSKCNTAIGLLDEDNDILNNMITYLIKYLKT